MSSVRFDLVHVYTAYEFELNQSVSIQDACVNVVIGSSHYTALPNLQY